MAAALFAYRQIKSNVASQLEVTANSIFVQYLRESMKYPEFIGAKADAFDFQAETFNDSHEKFVQYEFFVDIMLTSFELIFQLGPKEDWKQEIRAHVMEHQLYLSSEYFWKYEKVFEPEFSVFLRSCLKQTSTEGTIT